MTFTDPEVGSVGLTEAQAREQGSTPWSVATDDLGRAAAGSTAGNEGLIKLVADADRGVLVGATSSARPAARCSALLAPPCTREVAGRDAARACTSPTRPSTAPSRPSLDDLDL